MVKPTREKMIDAAVQSLRRHGVAGTSFTEVLAGSGAARGAIYHHFPGGKAELTDTAVRVHGANVVAAFEGVQGKTADAVVDAFLTLVRPVVAESAQGAGCAVAAVAVESAPGTDLQIAVDEVFAAWRASLAAPLRATGMSRREADRLATLMITTLEGAHVLCRADASIAPFDAAAAALRTLVTR